MQLMVTVYELDREIFIGKQIYHTITIYNFIKFSEQI